MREILERIAAPVRGLHQAAYLLAGLTLASQLLALLRDRIFAHTFGAGEVLDLYYAAFRVPDLVFALVASLVSAYVLIPRITGMGRESTRRLLSESATFLFGFGGLICIVLAVFMPQFLAFLYPNFSASTYQSEFVLLSRILLLQPILLGLSGVLASVTQVHRRFVLFAISPVLYNVGIIAGAVFLYPIWGLTGIGLGVIAGAVAYLAVNIPVVIGAGVLPSLRVPTFALMSSVMRDSVPRSLALGVGSVTALALTALASRIGTGAVSVFTFAINLEAVPLALIGSSYAIAAFPALSEASAPEKRDDFTRILSSSARHIILWSIVSLGLIIVLRAHIVRVILGTGAFDWNATRLTAAMLAVLAVGLAAQGLVILFSRALYAARQSWRPLFYQLAGCAVTIFLAAIFLFIGKDGVPSSLAVFMRVGDVHGTGILLLAVAATIGQIFLAILSLFALRNIAPGLAGTLRRPFTDGFLASIAGGASAYAVLLIEGGIAPLTTLMSVFTQGLVAGIVGLVVAGLALFIVENEEFRIVTDALVRLVRIPATRSGVLAPSAEEPQHP
ncbi:MAG: Integral membrane protein MviN [Parcubacteria group bacterium Gr01-1014_91]|nr:MAG: Integral membrane protein MviN [Parcubacteria group bacterium Gr01-1014_91]